MCARLPFEGSRSGRGDNGPPTSCRHSAGVCVRVCTCCVTCTMYVCVHTMPLHCVPSAHPQLYVGEKNTTAEETDFLCALELLQVAFEVDTIYNTVYSSTITYLSCCDDIIGQHM